MLALLLLAAAPAGPPAPDPPPSVVRVTNEHGAGPGHRTDGGSGVVVYAGGGYSLIATNRHVVEPTGRLHCYVPGRNYYARAELAAVAPAGDLALLRVPTELPAADLADPPADTALTLWGFPHGAEDPVAKTGRTLPPDGSTIRGLAVLPTTVRSEDGDSGGGQFDARGRLVCLSCTAAGSTVPATAVRDLLAARRKGDRR